METHASRVLHEGEESACPKSQVSWPSRDSSPISSFTPTSATRRHTLNSIDAAISVDTKTKQVRINLPTNVQVLVYVQDHNRNAIPPISNRPRGSPCRILRPSCLDLSGLALVIPLSSTRGSVWSPGAGVSTRAGSSCHLSRGKHAVR